jgi:hypothetical protein
MAGPGFSTDGAMIPALLNARYGRRVGDAITQVPDKETIVIEREFTRQPGSTADDRPPGWMRTEPLSQKFAVDGRRCVAEKDS